MGEMTGIGWCDSTANLWIGCSKISLACDFCYAEEMMGGLDAEKVEGEGRRLRRVCWGPDGDRSYCKSGWADIRKWQRAAARNGGVDPKLGRRRRIFVNSLSDFFDNHRTVIWRAEAWALIRECPDLIFILVTKRPQLIKRELPEFWDEIAGRVILMTTVETQQWADLRIPELLKACEGRAHPLTYALSIEPLLGPLDIAWALGNVLDLAAGLLARGHFSPGLEWLRPIGWAIIGGESGKHARPMHPEWAINVAVQILAEKVPLFFKQWGEWIPLTRMAHNDDPPGTVRQVGKAWIGDRSFEGDQLYHFPDGQPMVRAGKRADPHTLQGLKFEQFPEAA